MSRTRSRSYPPSRRPITTPPIPAHTHAHAHARARAYAVTPPTQPPPTIHPRARARTQARSHARARTNTHTHARARASVRLRCHLSPPSPPPPSHPMHAGAHERTLASPRVLARTMDNQVRFEAHARYPSGKGGSVRFAHHLHPHEAARGSGWRYGSHPVRLSQWPPPLARQSVSRRSDSE